MFVPKSEYLGALIVVLVATSEVQGHGMLLEPPGRSYDELNCGGFLIQWKRNGGLCGVCGDSYNDPQPRDNELGGKHGQTVNKRSYINQTIASLQIRIPVNHQGFFYFDLCNLDEFGVESEECFDKYPLALSDGSYKQYIDIDQDYVNSTVILPPGLSCNHCVLRWNYQGGDRLGHCEDGTEGLGCGPQDNYKNCADISILTN